jgi:signal transduction histidine kinase
MPDPTSPPAPLRRIRWPVLAAAGLAAIALALLIPGWLGLPRDAAPALVAAMLAVLGLGVLATRSGQVRVAGEDHRSAHCESQLLQLLSTLPTGVVLLVDGRIRAANTAACLQLGGDEARLREHDPLSLFEAPADADEALADAPFDRAACLRRLDGSLYRAQVSARRIAFGAGAARLLLLGDQGEAERLAADLEARRGELQTLARRLMTLQEDERAALSRELHDDIGQAITAVKLCASSLLLEPDPPRRAVVMETAQEIAQIADQTVAKLRDLSLLLRPPQLDELGLEAALRWQAGRLFRGDGPVLELDIPVLECRPPREVELACFRIAQEAMTNILRHAQATRVSLRLQCDDAFMRLRIEDDGRGLARGRCAGLGLVTMRERAQQLGGEFRIDSRPGRTCVEASLPLHPPPATG